MDGLKSAGDGLLNAGLPSAGLPSAGLPSAGLPSAKRLLLTGVITDPLDVAVLTIDGARKFFLKRLPNTAPFVHFCVTEMINN